MPRGSASQAVKPDREPRGSSISRAFEIIRVLRRTSNSMTLTSLAEAVGIAPSTAHSILSELLAQGMVDLDGDKRYRLGPALYYVGSAFARGTPVYRSIWMELVDLANEFELTASVAVPWEDHHLILMSHTGGRGGVDVAFGGMVPLQGGSWGKAYYAWSGADIPKAITKFTDQSITDATRYRKEVERARLDGFAIDREEFSPGVGGVAAGVTSSSGYEGLASLMGSLAQFEDLTFDKLGRRLAGLASRASLSLGDLGRVRAVGAH